MCCPPTYLLHWPQQDQQDKAGAGICAGPKSRNAGLPSAKNNTNKHSAERTIRLTLSSSPLARNVSHLRFRRDAARYDTCKKTSPAPCGHGRGWGREGNNISSGHRHFHVTRACLSGPGCAAEEKHLAPPITHQPPWSCYFSNDNSSVPVPSNRYTCPRGYHRWFAGTQDGQAAYKIETAISAGDCFVL